MLRSGRIRDLSICRQTAPGWRPAPQSPFELATVRRLHRFATSTERHPVRATVSRAREHQAVGEESDQSDSDSHVIAGSERHPPAGAFQEQRVQVETSAADQHQSGRGTRPFQDCAMAFQSSHRASRHRRGTSRTYVVIPPYDRKSAVEDRDSVGPVAPGETATLEGIRYSTCRRQLR